MPVTTTPESLKLSIIRVQQRRIPADRLPLSLVKQQKLLESVDENATDELADALTALLSQLQDVPVATVQPLFPLLHSTLQSLIAVDCWAIRLRTIKGKQRKTLRFPPSMLYELVFKLIQTLLPLHTDQDSLHGFGLVLLDLFVGFPDTYTAILLQFFNDRFFLQSVSLASSGGTEASEQRLAIIPLLIERCLSTFPTSLMQSKPTDSAESMQWHRLLSECFRLRPDLTVDLLALVGCANKTLRLNACIVLLHLCPRLGHVRLDERMPIVIESARTETSSVISQMRWGKRHDKMPNNTPITSQANIPSPRIPTAVTHSWRPVWVSHLPPNSSKRTTRKTMIAQGVKCNACAMSFTGFGVQCLDCGMAMHLDCCIRRHHQHAVTDATGEFIWGKHKMAPATLLSLQSCNMCQYPCFGVVHQSLQCQECGLIVHRECMATDKIPACGDLTCLLETKKISLKELMRRFKDFYAPAYEKEMAPMEAVIWYAVLSIQHGMMAHALATRLIDYQNDLDGDFLKEIELHVMYLASVMQSDFDIYADWSLKLAEIVLSLFHENDHTIFSPVSREENEFKPISDIGIQMMDTSKMLALLMTKLNLSLDAALTLVQQSMAVGILGHSSRKPLLCKTKPKSLSDVSGQIMVPLPFYHEPFGRTLTSAIVSCLKSPDEAINEFGLNLLLRRCPPQFFSERIGKQVMLAILQWLTRDSTDATSASASSKVSQATSALSDPFSDSAEEDDASLFVRSKKLRDRTAIPWLRAVHAHHPQDYAYILWSFIKVYSKVINTRIIRRRILCNN